MKKCSKCSLEKEVTDFYDRSASKDGKHGWCKACCCNIANSWGHRYPERRKECNRINSAKKYLIRKELIDSIKISKGCIDCGYKDHPAALHFDHIERNDKNFKISGNHMRRLEIILTEIDKCVVRCANCHAIKTFNNEDTLPI